MQRISNDRLPSTTHRVSQPRDPEARRRPRISLPMAIYVWDDEILEVLPGLGEPNFPPVSALAFHTHTTAQYYAPYYSVTGCGWYVALLLLLLLFVSNSGPSRALFVIRCFGE